MDSSYSKSIWILTEGEESEGLPTSRERQQSYDCTSRVWCSSIQTSLEVPQQRSLDTTHRSILAHSWIPAETQPRVEPRRSACAFWLPVSWLGQIKRTRSLHGSHISLGNEVIYIDPLNKGIHGDENNVCLSQTNTFATIANCPLMWHLWHLNPFSCSGNKHDILPEHSAIPCWKFLAQCHRVERFWIKAILLCTSTNSDQCAPSDERKSLRLSLYSVIILTGFVSTHLGLKESYISIQSLNWKLIRQKFIAVTLTTLVWSTSATKLTIIKEIVTGTLSRCRVTIQTFSRDWWEWWMTTGQRRERWWRFAKCRDGPTLSSRKRNGPSNAISWSNSTGVSLKSEEPKQRKAVT